MRACPRFSRPGLHTSITVFLGRHWGLTRVVGHGVNLYSKRATAGPRYARISVVGIGKDEAPGQ